MDRTRLMILEVFLAKSIMPGLEMVQPGIGMPSHYLAFKLEIGRCAYDPAYRRGIVRAVRDRLLESIEAKRREGMDVLCYPLWLSRVDDAVVVPVLIRPKILLAEVPA